MPQTDWKRIKSSGGHRSQPETVKPKGKGKGKGK